MMQGHSLQTGDKTASNWDRRQISIKTKVRHQGEGDFESFGPDYQVPQHTSDPETQEQQFDLHHFYHETGIQMGETANQELSGRKGRK